MSTSDAEPGQSTPSERVAQTERTSASGAAGVFAVLTVLAGPVIAMRNRQQWFLADEYVFLFKRELGDPSSWFAPHWGHLTALPALAYQALYQGIGMHHYWPYQWLVIGSHLMVTVLLRRLMRRAGVDPWLATSAMIPFLFLGAGRENLEWGFQVTLTGSLAFGFGALVVLVGSRGATHRGRATAGALLVGAILCSSVGVVMVLFATLTVLLIDRSAWRHGPRRNAVVSVATVAGPASLVYLAWMTLAPASEYGPPTSGPEATIRFASRALVAAGEGYSQSPLVALAMVVVTAVGLAALVRRVLAEPDVAPGTLVAIVLASAPVVVVLLIGYGRAADPFVGPRTTRYVYVVLALALVPVAAALQEVVRQRGTAALVGVCALMLVGLPGNLSRLGPTTDQDHERLGSVAELQHIADLVVPSDLPDDEEIVGEITAGALRDARRSGRMPVVPVDAETAARATVRVALRVEEAAGSDCEPLDPAEPALLRAGDHLVYDYASEITVAYAGDDGPLSEITVNPKGRVRPLYVRLGPVNLWVTSPSPDPVQRCR